MRDKALATERGATYRLIEVKFGVCAASTCVRDGQAGSARRRAELDAGRDRGRRRSRPSTTDGEPRALRWDEVALDPGWCKLDWVVADPERKRAGQRQQRDRRHLGGARRHDRAARRLPRRLLPGGLPGRRLDADLLEGGPARVGRRPRRLRRPARGRGRQVPRPRTSTTARPPSGCTTSSA